MSIEDGIVYKIKNEVTALNSRIFSMTADDFEILPYVIYQRVGTRRYPTLTDQGDFEPTFQFNIYADDYSEMISLRDSVREVFENATGIYTSGAPNVQETSIITEFENYNPETKRFEGILEIKFFYN